MKLLLKHDLGGDLEYVPLCSEWTLPGKCWGVKSFQALGCVFSDSPGHRKATEFVYWLQKSTSYEPWASTYLCLSKCSDSCTLYMGANFEGMGKGKEWICAICRL